MFHVKHFYVECIRVKILLNRFIEPYFKDIFQKMSCPLYTYQRVFPHFLCILGICPL